MNGGKNNTKKTSHREGRDRDSTKQSAIGLKDEGIKKGGRAARLEEKKIISPDKEGISSK